MENKTKTNFSEYISGKITPKEKERSIISELYTELSTILADQCFQTGSYARFTANTPVHDLDVIWKLPSETAQRIRTMMARAINPNDVDVKDILNELRNKLEREYKTLNRQVSFGVQSHSVTLDFQIPIENGEIFDISIDVVPGIILPENDKFNEPLFLVPEIALMSRYKRLMKYERKDPINWIKSDPKGYIEYARHMNNENELFRKCTKFLKSWKNKQKYLFEDFKLKSFHIELIVADLISKKSHQLGIDVLKEFFLKLPEFLKTPQFVDFAYENDSSKYVDEYIEDVPENVKNYILAKSQEAWAKISVIHSDNDTNIGSIFDEITQVDEQSIEPQVKIKSNIPYKPYSINNEDNRTRLTLP